MDSIQWNSILWSESSKIRDRIIYNVCETDVRDKQVQKNLMLTTLLTVYKPIETPKELRKCMKHE